MNKDLHNTDDFFKDAYRQFEEEPAPDMWQKINAGLDKKDTASNRRKFIWWKRTAMLLLLLIAGFVVFDPGIFKMGFNQSNLTKNLPPTEPVNKDYELKKNKTKVAVKEINAMDQKGIHGDPEVANNFPVNQNSISSPGSYPFDTRKIPWNKKNPFEKYRPGNEQLFKEENQEKNTHDLANQTDRIQQNKIIIFPLIEKINSREPLTSLIKSTMLEQLYTPYNSIKKKDEKNMKLMKNNSFNPYWLITAFTSYDRVNYKLDSELPGNITSIKHGEVHEPSFSGGILATRQLNKYWGLQTGLIYSNTAIGISPQKLYALQDPAGDVAFKYNTSSGYAYIKPGLGRSPVIGDSLQVTEGKHVIRFISVPLLVKYTLGKNKFTITPGVGIEASILTNAKVETEIEHPVNPEIVFINKLDGAKSFHLSIVADAELRYKLNKKLLLNIRPALRYAISPITKNNVVETFPYSFGLGLGVTYILR